MAIQEKQGIHYEQIKLVYMGRQLDDNSTLEKSKLKAGAQIHMVMQLRGGF